MTSYDKLRVREEDAIRLILEFLSRRDLCISQLSLERESGIYNCNLSDDLIFLRQLILDGQWDDALQFVSPLESVSTFSSQEFSFLIYKHKYVELLCIRSEAGSPYQTVEVAVQDIIQCLTHLEKYCPDREVYNRLSSLLTIPNLADDDELKNWNPNSWRLKCFNDVKPLVEKFMQSNSCTDGSNQISKNDRLMNLIFKGLMYEVCLNSIKQKLHLNDKSINLVEPDVVNGIDDDLNLHCFIKSLPESLFEYFSDSNRDAFMHLDIEKHDKPVLVASWSEMILSTPIKPNVFPHTAVPYTRIKAADLMSKSLTSSLMQNSNAKDLMTMSVCDIAQFSRSTLAYTGFHLNTDNSDQNKHCDNAMETSVNRLFQSEDVFSTSILCPGDNSSDFRKMPTITEKPTPTDSTKDGDFIENANIEPNCEDSSSQSGMNESYIDIWMNYQREKNKLLSIMKGGQSCQSSTSMRSAQKNREASNKLSAASNNNITNTTASSSNSSGGGGSVSKPGRACTIQPHRSAHQQTSEESDPKVVFTTPITERHPKIKPLTSTPKSNHPNQARRELIETDHVLWNSPIAKTKPQPLVNISIDHDFKHGPRSSLSPSSPTPSSHHSHSHLDLSSNVSTSAVNFVPIATIQDQQAIRAAEFHPSGKYFAVGSNSKVLRVYNYSSHDSNNNNAADATFSLSDISEPDILHKRQKYHKGSIYCLTWNRIGNLLATGSNDKTIKLLNFNQDTQKFNDNAIELSVHDGTVRDLCFMDDLTNGSSLLLSGGAGDCKIYITDCETSTTFLSLSGHSGPILSLYNWGGAMFVSGSQDRTIRFWDLRSNSCINFVTCPTISRTKPGGAVAAVCVDPSGKLLVSGHEDSTCMLYDIRGGRVIQTFHPHSSDIRSIRFSNKAYYLLSGGYDNNIVLTDLQGDLTQALKSVVVATHQDKVIQCRWHPSDFTFLSTSADKSATLWALPD